jgi:uridine kinase
MQGDRILVQDKHDRAADGISQILLPMLELSDSRFALSISGESGSGKSELAVAMQEALKERGIGVLILQQDDYFVYPPHTNDARRRENISRVGPAEVRLGLLDAHLKSIICGQTIIDKPLVLYQENKIATETAQLDGVGIVIAEGTYTSLLKNVHSRVFIDLSYKQTKVARLNRNREPPDPFLEQVLEIEHKIISLLKACADIIVTDSFTVRRQPPKREVCDSLFDHEAMSREVIASVTDKSML